MEQPLRGHWEQEEDNPTFGFLMTAPLTTFNKVTENCLTCLSPENTGLWSETRAAVTRALHGVIGNVFSGTVIARPVIYQPASSGCWNVADVFSMHRESVRGLAE